MIEKLRLKLATVDALPQLAMLGVLSGLFSGGVIIAFRFVVETTQTGFLPDANPENYEALSLSMRFMIPAAGGLLIGLIFQFAGKESTYVGVVHVLERLSYHQGVLPVKNFFMQFIGAALSIISGHSVGREGPGIHLGAAASSLMGQSLQLPNNSMRTLVACGAAASIAASFNTPIAGIIFAMEVIVMEYTIAGFIPIILATVSATVLTRFVYGDEPAFMVTALELGSLTQLWIIVLMGILFGALAALFIWLIKATSKVSARLPIWQRMAFAGIFTGLISVLVPEVMGIGYDTVNAAMLGELGLLALTIIVVAKLFATTIGIGCGLPAGLIGPTLVIGAAAGGAVGVLASELLDVEVASPGFYAMIGMGAMMGAALQAPLAALMALLELTLNTNIILPGMLVIVISGIVSSHVFRQQSVFLMLLKARGLDYRHDPISQALRRVGVASVMDRSLVSAQRIIKRADAQQLLLKEPNWVVVRETGKPLAIMLCADLLHYLSAEQQEDIDLLGIPALRYDCVQINIRATLQHALETMDEKQVDAVYVGNTDSDDNTTVLAVVTRQSIETHYRYR